MLVLQARALLSRELANHQWHQTVVRKDNGYIRDEAAQEPEGCQRIFADGWLLQETHK